MQGNNKLIRSVKTIIHRSTPDGFPGSLASQQLKYDNVCGKFLSY